MSSSTIRYIPTTLPIFLYREDAFKKVKAISFKETHYLSIKVKENIITQPILPLHQKKSGNKIVFANMDKKHNIEYPGHLVVFPKDQEPLFVSTANMQWPFCYCYDCGWEFYDFLLCSHGRSCILGLRCVLILCSVASVHMNY